MRCGGMEWKSACGVETNKCHLKYEANAKRVSMKIDWNNLLT